MPVSGSRRRQRGVAAIEMAITLPVLLFMLLAIAEFGRAFHQYNTLSKAVHSATRYLSTTALDGFKTIDLTDAKRNAVRNLVVYASTDGGGETNRFDFRLGQEPELPPENLVKPEVSAPGVDVYSSVPGGGYQQWGWSGTSMATPHVAGAYAMLRSASSAATRCSRSRSSKRYASCRQVGTSPPRTASLTPHLGSSRCRQVRKWQPADGSSQSGK